MPSQTQKEKLAKKEAVELAELDTQRQEEQAKQGDKIKAELDELMDEIDGVLEENAQEFVNNFRQVGGE